MDNVIESVWVQGGAVGISLLIVLYALRLVYQAQNAAFGAQQTAAKFQQQSLEFQSKLVDNNTKMTAVMQSGQLTSEQMGKMTASLLESDVYQNKALAAVQIRLEEHDAEQGRRHDTTIANILEVARDLKEDIDTGVVRRLDALADSLVAFGSDIKSAVRELGEAIEDQNKGTQQQEPANQGSTD